MNVWDLSSLYLGFDDPVLQQDEHKLDNLIIEVQKLISNLEKNNPEQLISILDLYIQTNTLASKLFSFASFKVSSSSTMDGVSLWGASCKF